MDDPMKNIEEKFSKEVTEDGKTVTIIVRLIDADEKLWELSIQGRENQLTTWTDWYFSPKEAMDEGMKAILSEGIKEFYSNPEFVYN